MSDQTETDRQLLGSRLKESREYLDLSQDEVAKFLKMPRSAISLIESGERKIDAIELKKFADLYGRSLEYFLMKDSNEEVAPDIAHLARTATELTEQDRGELLRFAQFLKTRSK